MYFLKKILGSILSLVAVSALTFFLVRVAPGGPFDTDTLYPAEIKNLILEKYGLNQAVSTQYWLWIKDSVRGEFRESFQYLGQSVSSILWPSLQKSSLLGGISLFIAWVGGVILGACSAAKKGSLLDRMIFWMTAIGMSLPSYLTATLLILVFSIHLQWFPAALWGGAPFLVLPILTLSLRPLGVITRYTRRSMIEALSSNYIRTAYAQGVPHWRIIFIYALRNSLIAPVAALGTLGTHLVSGSFLVENVFQIPGLGRHFVMAALNRDYPLLMAATLIYGVILIAFQGGSDFLLAMIDPRIQAADTESLS